MTGIVSMHPDSKNPPRSDLFYYQKFSAERNMFRLRISHGPSTQAQQRPDLAVMLQHVLEDREGCGHVLRVALGFDEQAVRHLTSCTPPLASLMP